jgi:hypothetical protein
MSAKKLFCYIQSSFGFDIPVPKEQSSDTLPRKYFDIKFINNDLKVEIPEIGYVSLTPNEEDYIVKVLNKWIQTQPKTFLASTLIKECKISNEKRIIMLYRFNNKDVVNYSKRIFYHGIELTEEVLEQLSGDNSGLWKDKEKVGFRLPYAFKTYFN